MTHIVTEIFDEKKDAEIIAWFNEFYIPVKVNKAAQQEKKRRKRKAQSEDVPESEQSGEPEYEEVIKRDPLFERSLTQYTRFLDMVPERALLAAAKDAVHRLANDIKDPNTHEGHLN
jgi:hypothetical protein